MAGVQEVGVSSLHAKRCVQRLNQRIKVGLEEEWNPGGSNVTPYPTAGLESRRMLTKHWNMRTRMRNTILDPRVILRTDNYYPGE